MEGVCFALKNSIDIFDELGLHSNRIIASGGGAKSEVWLQMQANIFEKEVVVSAVSEQAALGACLLAGIGVGIYKDAKHACSIGTKFRDKIYEPIQQEVKIYRGLYEIYNELYKQNFKSFMRLDKLSIK